MADEPRIPGFGDIDLAKMIDHSLLHPTLTDQELKAGCRLAARYNVASVCFKPYAVKLAAGLLKGTRVKVGAVVGFPHGASTTEVKRYETEVACRDGAAEIDMVIHVGKALSGDWKYVERDIRAVVREAHRRGAIVKVIFENDFLPDDAIKKKLCRICEKTGADFVKTSTGYGFVKGPDGKYSYQGATEHDLRLMRANVIQGAGQSWRPRTISTLLGWVNAVASRKRVWTGWLLCWKANRSAATGLWAGSPPLTELGRYSTRRPTRRAVSSPRASGVRRDSLATDSGCLRRVPTAEPVWRGCSARSAKICRRVRLAMARQVRQRVG